jgi:hypothetical protein
VWMGKAPQSPDSLLLGSLNSESDHYNVCRY